MSDTITSIFLIFLEYINIITKGSFNTNKAQKKKKKYNQRKDMLGSWTVEVKRKKHTEITPPSSQQSHKSTKNILSGLLKSLGHGSSNNKYDKFQLLSLDP